LKYKLAATSMSNIKPSIREKFKRIGLVFLVALFVSAAWFFIQVRTNYYAKVSVTEAVKFAEQVAAAVGSHQNQFGRFPSSMTEIALPQGDAGYVPHVTIEPASGVLTFVIENSEGSFGTFRFIPNPAGGRPLSWRCESVSVAPEKLPTQCSP
jgi:hypothetical protein